MKISIITATYDSGATIKDTMDCIRSQDYGNIEHIIVDGKSADDTLAIVAGYPHVSRVVSEKDNGLYDAMNKGIAMATGDVIGILNSDDIYSGPWVLSTVARTFEKKGVMTAYGDLQYVHPQDTARVIRTWKSGSFRRENFYYGWMPPHPTFFVRKEIYGQVGGFNTTLRSAADYELMLRILLKHDFPTFYIPKTLVKMRTGGTSNASLHNRIKANGEDRLAWKLNELKPYFFTLYLKPLRKIHQFILK